MVGFEPTTTCLQNRCATPAPHWHWWANSDLNREPPCYEQGTLTFELLARTVD